MSSDRRKKLLQLLQQLTYWIPIRAGFRSFYILDLEAEAGHHERRVDAGARSSKAELGAGGAGELRGKSVLHYAIGDAGVDIEVLGDNVVRQERYLVERTGAVVRACALCLPKT